MHVLVVDRLRGGNTALERLARSIRDPCISRAANGHTILRRPEGVQRSRTHLVAWRHTRWTQAGCGTQTASSTPVKSGRNQHSRPALSKTKPSCAIRFSPLFACRLPRLCSRLAAVEPANLAAIPRRLRLPQPFAAAAAAPKRFSHGQMPQPDWLPDAMQPCAQNTPCQIFPLLRAGTWRVR